jgi:hypothetical protein
VAAALRPPSAARLEFLGPLGGSRLVVATDGGRATAFRPAERQFDTAEGTPASMERLLGLPLDGERLVALLSGSPRCATVNAPAGAPWGGARRPGAGGTGSRPAGDLVFTADGEAPDAPPAGAVLRDREGGAIIARVEYADRPTLPGGCWPRGIRVRLPAQEVTLSLTALDGPAAARLADDLFAPPIPDGFEQRPIFGGPGDPALFGMEGSTGR